MGLRLCHRSLDHNREHRARAGILQLYALCHPDHPASSRVLEKCGFRFEQRLEGACAESVLSPRDSDDTSNRAFYADHWWRHIEGWREAEGDPILIPTLRESVEFRCDFAAGIIAPEYLLLILNPGGGYLNACRSLCSIGRHSKIHLVSIHSAGVAHRAQYLRSLSIDCHPDGRVDGR